MGMHERGGKVKAMPIRNTDDQINALCDKAVGKRLTYKMLVS